MKETNLLAEVEASGSQKSYNASVKFDCPQGDKIKHVKCECMAFYQYKSLCKHIIAAILMLQSETEKKRQSNNGVYRILKGFSKKIAG